jgi:putative tryptophan/tyrosine transport system substrate-binding protein
MRRREFIAAMGSAAAWPVAARAQQDERVWRIGVIMAIEGDDPQMQARLAAFRTGLQQLGWVEGRNVRIIVRSNSGAQNISKNVAELIALKPDVLLSAGVASLAPLLQATRTLPVVFVNVADPVGAGLIDSLAQPQCDWLSAGRIQSERQASGTA